MVHATRVMPLWFAAAVVSVCPAVSAQEVLTVDQAVREVIAHNASLRAARATVSEADGRVDEARSGWFPRVSVTESWQRGDEPVFVFGSLLSARRFATENFGIDALNHPDDIGLFRSAIALEQLLFDGGRQRSAQASATSRREITQLSLDESSAGLMVAAVHLSGRILLAEAGQRTAEAALEAAREDLTRAQHRRDLGVATDADVLSLVTHVAELEQQTIQHRGEAGVARAELNRLMGAPIQREYQLAPPSDTEPGALAATSVDLLLAEADRQRPELRRAAAAQRVADADRTNARAALLPQVAAHAEFDVSGTRFSDRASAWIAGAQVRWSFSLGGAELARVRAARDAHARAVAEAEDTRAAVHVEVVTALRQLQSATARRLAGRAAVEQARESHRMTRDRFEAGLAGVTDVLRASSAVVDAERQRISAAVDAVVSGAMLRRAVGRSP
jgi:outer membrane protein